MNRFAILGTAALVGTSAVMTVIPANAASNNYDRFYIAPLGNYTISSHKRKAGNGWGGGLAFGKQLGRYFNLETDFYLHGLRQKNFRNAPDWEIHGFDLNGLIFLSRNPAFAPYVKLGVGATRNQGDNVNGSTDLSYNAGLGFTHQLTRSGIEFRADAGWRYTRYTPGTGYDTDFNDYEFNVGLVFPFGGREKPAPKPKPQPVAVAPQDSDHDGVPDNIDQCPNTPAGVAVDAKGCPLDSDHDGVPNYKDQCPNTRPDTKVNQHGCKVVQSHTLKHVNFAFNSAHLTAGAQRRLKAVVPEIKQTLHRYPGVHVEIGGYTDSIGTNAYNQKLSQRRADAVVSFLKAHGVQSDRLVAHGYGEQHPVASNKTAVGRAKNRRVEVRVLAH